MSITTQYEYFANLDILQNVNQPSYALLPAAEKIYDIDVDERLINNRNITLVEKDHKSKTLYFSIDRYVDYMDLAQTKCIIQYNTTDEAGKVRTRFYPVPFYDVYTKVEEGKIIFPWNLDYNVTKTAGSVPFNIRFFKVGTRITEDNNAELILTYNLNIQPSWVKVEKSLYESMIDKDDETYLQPGDVDILMDYVDKKMQTLSRKIYWTVLSDEFTDSTIDVSAELQEDLLDVLEAMEDETQE
jgi:hypothetical protein